MISEHNAKQRCQWLITAMVGKDLADVWWSTPNRAFDMRTPAGIWLEDYLKVYKYLMARAGE
jgi:hypothetical protein